MLGYSGGPKVMTQVLIRERQESQSQKETWQCKQRLKKGKERFEDAMLLVLKVEEGATSQRT